MKSHTRKLIAPIVISVVIVLYYVGFAVACAVLSMPLPVKLICGILPLIFAGVTVYVLIERIKEIRSGEEDDLSQY
ncbi:MAG: hypothetical protein AB7D36_04460 [Oscillospiraceae bacterium]